MAMPQPNYVNYIFSVCDAERNQDQCHMLCSPAYLHRQPVISWKDLSLHALDSATESIFATNKCISLDSMKLLLAGLPLLLQIALVTLNWMPMKFPLADICQSLSRRSIFCSPQRIEFQMRSCIASA